MRRMYEFDIEVVEGCFTVHRVIKAVEADTFDDACDKAFVIGERDLSPDASRNRAIKLTLRATLAVFDMVK